MSVRIPPRPALLLALQNEVAKETPHLKRLTDIIARDPALAGSFIGIANSPFFYRRQEIRTVHDAVNMLGIDQLACVLAGLVARQIIGFGGKLLPRFWDVSEKRAKGLSFVTRELDIAPPALAYNLGLFCDIGIPLMMSRFPNYRETLALANRFSDARFLHVENERHKTNHTEVGALLSATWGISPEVTAAIRFHHVPLDTIGEAARTRHLIACNMLVEKAIDEFRGERDRGHVSQDEHAAAESLGLSAADLDDLCDRLVLRFAGMAEWNSRGDTVRPSARREYFAS
ncbi:MAG TPA: HDOD domain-containing protein [Noviherbaspirillum sp.]|nr:HDOD domain-containing protein [Noviherbaspirillum sp.]